MAHVRFAKSNILLNKMKNFHIFTRTEGDLAKLFCLNKRGKKPMITLFPAYVAYLKTTHLPI